jgi:hypothetical protein
VTAVPLADVVELNVPQGVAPLQLHVTPAFVGSLSTVATMDVVWPWFIVAGGVVIATVIGCLKLLLHPTKAAIIPKLITSRIVLRKVIAHLR